MKKNKIVMTGGGSAGHVTPNLALIPGLKQLGYEIEYIGTKDGIERKLIEDAGIKYHVISTGKIRRYFDIKNFTDPFRVVKGVFEARKIIKKINPDIVFSKGGFVAVPVVLGAFLNRIPVVAHESDITPGLANKLSLPYCTKICITFPEALEHVNKNKAVITGTPIRTELMMGSKEKGLKMCGFDGKKKVLMIIGGSLGSAIINKTIRFILDDILKKFDVVHLCGKGNIDSLLETKKGYKQFEYVGEEMPHLFSMSDLVISRAGANSIFELLTLKIPNILIPLSKRSSRGDQILNAESFEKRGYSIVLQEEAMKAENLLECIDKLETDRAFYIENMNKSEIASGIENVLKVIKDETRTVKQK